MEREPSLSESFEDQVRLMSQHTILSPEYRRKKLLIWGVRTCITIVLYIIFWEHTWVRWTLIAVAPLSILSLIMIVGMNYFLQRKIAMTRLKVEAADALIPGDSTIERE